MSLILIVDDDDEILSLLETLLRRAGFNVVTSSNGLGALESIRDGLRPDLIILDVMMPEVHGWEVGKALKESPESESIPIVILSAKPDKEPSFSFTGADWHVPKPVDKKILLFVLELALRKGGIKFNKKKIKEFITNNRGSRSMVDMVNPKHLGYDYSFIEKCRRS